MDTLLILNFLWPPQCPYQQDLTLQMECIKAKKPSWEEANQVAILQIMWPKI